MPYQVEKCGLEGDYYGYRGNHSFLIRMVRELISHKNILGTCMQTALVYGACIGKNIHIRKQNIQLPGSGQRQDYEAELKLNFLDIYRMGISGKAAIVFGYGELDWDCLLSPAELAQKLGWNSH